MSYRSKSFRKFMFSSVTSAIVVTTGAASVSASDFVDIDSKAWYADVVNELAAAGVFGGVGNNKFDPNATVTNAQAYAAISKAFNLDEKNAPASSFADAKSHWAEGAINALAAKGILKGDDSGKVNPNKSITREQLVVLLIRALGIEEDKNATHNFTDVPAGHWAERAIATAVAHGITNGIGDGKFGLGENANRAQLAGFLYKESVRTELPAWVEYEKEKKEEQKQPSSGGSGGGPSASPTEYTVSTPAEFSNALNNNASKITISGDIPNGSEFDLNGKTIQNLEINLSGMAGGETITIKGGTIDNLIITDKDNITLVQNSVTINNFTIK